MLFVYASPVLMPFIYNIQFALLDNVQFIHGLFYPSTRGILHFDFMRPLLNPGYAFHSYIPTKTHPIEVHFPHPILTAHKLF